MGIRDNTPEIYALGSNQMLFNASDALQSLPSVHALRQGHTVHTSGSQISLCEGKQPKHKLTIERPRIMEHQKSTF